jgi:hypothetical protein
MNADGVARGEHALAAQERATMEFTTDEHRYPQMDADIAIVEFFDDDDEHDDDDDDETGLNSVSCGFGAGNFFEKMMEVDGL